MTVRKSVIIDCRLSYSINYSSCVAEHSHISEFSSDEMILLLFAHLIDKLVPRFMWTVINNNSFSWFGSIRDELFKQREKGVVREEMEE